MAQKKKGKTETIKQRSLYLYLPSEEMVDEWKELAEKSGLSISKFIQEHVHNSLNQDLDKDFTPRHLLLDNLKKTEEENKKLKDEIRKLDALVEKLDNELRSYRLKDFANETEGIKTLDSQLIDLFKTMKSVRSDEILPRLDINPRDSEAVKSVNKQIDVLEDFGLIESNRVGWRWKG